MSVSSRSLIQLSFVLSFIDKADIEMVKRLEGDIYALLGEDEGTLVGRSQYPLFIDSLLSTSISIHILFVDG